MSSWEGNNKINHYKKSYNFNYEYLNSLKNKKDACKIWILGLQCRILTQTYWDKNQYAQSRKNDTREKIYRTFYVGCILAKFSYQRQKMSNQS